MIGGGGGERACLFAAFVGDSGDEVRRLADQAKLLRLQAQRQHRCVCVRVCVRVCDAGQPHAPTHSPLGSAAEAPPPSAPDNKQTHMQGDNSLIMALHPAVRGCEWRDG